MNQLHIHVHKGLNSLRVLSTRSTWDNAAVRVLANNITALVKDADFKEGEHPRAPDGQFAANGGGSTKPTAAAAKGSKSGVHELLSTGHPFTIEELMAATGTTSRATIATALSDLKNPKYAGGLGALSIVKRSDGMFHVAKEEPAAPRPTAPTTKSAPEAERAQGEVYISRVDRSDPSSGVQHIARIHGDPREFPLVRADSTTGLGPVWTPGVGGAWDNYAQGPAPSHNGYINQSYMGDTKVEALRSLPDLVKRLDASPHYKLPPPRETYTGPDYHVTEPLDSDMFAVYKHPGKEKLGTYPSFEMAERVRKLHDTAAVEKHVSSLKPVRAKMHEPVAAKPTPAARAPDIAWKKDSWQTGERADLPGDYKVYKTPGTDGSNRYTVRGGGSKYIHHIHVDEEGKVLRHNREEPVTITTVKGPGQSTSSRGLNPNQAAQHSDIYRALGLTKPTRT